MVRNFMFGNILETIEGFLQPLITSALAFLEGFPVWVQGLILFALALFAIVGIFVFIKKFFKLFLVLAILGAVGYYLYKEGIITDLLGNLTGTLLSTLL